MSRLFDLSDTAIEDGITVVEASAGTGKTYCLVGLALRLLLERRVSDVSQLLVVTFTRAATQELVERLREALTLTCRLLAGEAESADPFFRRLAEAHGGDEEALRVAREALVRFDDLTVSTIHGFCLRVLGDSAFESGEPFDGELVANADAILLEAARDVWRRLIYRAPAIVATVVTDAGWTPESFLPDYELAHQHPKTEILPVAADLDAATASLSDAHDTLRQAWNPAAIRMLLEPRRFLRGSYFAGKLKDRLGAAEAFCTDGDPAGLRPVLELAGDRLEASLFKRDRTGVAKHPVVVACTAFAAAVAAFHHALRCRFVADVAERFEADKRASLKWTYDDLLRRLRRALVDPRRGRALARSVHRRYRAALIDEFQDTDLIQYQIFHRLFRRGPLILIGDPKQAIYRFRGADVFAYLSARDGADRVYTLDRNWRTEAPLVEAVNAVFSRSASSRPFVFEQIAFEPVAAALPAGDPGDSRPLQWIWMPRLRTRELARSAIEDAVTGEIARLLSTGEASRPDDVAVLVRTNEQAASLQSALRDAGIPSVIGRSGDIFHSQEMADLEILLNAIVDPGDGGLLRAAWATRLWGASDRDIREANRGDQSRGVGSARNAPADVYARRLEQFTRYRRDWHRRGFMPMIQQLFAERRVRRRLEQSIAGQRRLTNLTHATEVLHQAEHQRHMSPAALLGWLAAERARERPETEDIELRLESDAAAVQIVTVHRAKGLEYEIVFCPYLWQARPASTEPVQAHVDGSRLILDYGSEAVESHRAQAEAERLSEDARLTYVALTRARRRCYVVWGDVPGQHGPASSALGYLLHRGRDHAGGAGRSPATPGALAQRALESVKDGREGWYRELGRLIAAHDRVMELRSIEELAASVDGWLGDPKPAAELRPRLFRGSIPRPWSIESFSSLSRASHSAGTIEPEVDDPAMPAALQRIPPSPPFSKGGTRGAPEGTSAPTAPLPNANSLTSRSEVASSGDGNPSSTNSLITPSGAVNPPASDPPTATDSLVPPFEKGGLGGISSPSAGMFAFARGRRAGSCLHRVLERIDLARLDDDASDDVIDEALRRFGLEDPTRHASAPPGYDPAAVVRDMLRRLAAAPLPGSNAPLAEVPRDGWLVEWKFTMPLGRLNPQRLAKAFGDHGSGAIGSEYPALLERLGQDEVHGYLTGFVDTLFEHDGRWYLIDWKSNDLGPSLAAYDDEGMWQAMAYHHYVLQYHLYLVALHRFLKPRIDGYDFARHVAGAYYVFLRGLEAGSPSGWYVDQPPVALIEALDDLIGGRA